jgi:hypothetical protein
MDGWLILRPMATAIDRPDDRGMIVIVLRITLVVALALACWAAIIGVFLTFGVVAGVLLSLTWLIVGGLAAWWRRG